MSLLPSLWAVKSKKLIALICLFSATFQQVNNIPISQSKCKTNDVDWCGESGQLCLVALN